MKPIKVLIVDDQHLFAESLKFVLQGEAGGRIEVVGIGENGREAVLLAAERRPDVVLMDIRMPVMDGVEATSLIHRDHPDIKIMILTTFDDDELAVNALSHGATGYVLKNVDPSDLVFSIEAVHRGVLYISSSAGVKLLDMVRSGPEDAQRERETLIIQLVRSHPSLTRREAEVLYFAAKAWTNKAVGEELNISEKTIKNHMSSIYEKLRIHSRLGLINYVTGVGQKTRNSSSDS